jgi:PIN domain nuclease of toxin-antitoxin system
MNSYFFDSSALVKRYLTETGSDWVHSNTDLKTGHTVTVVEITVKLPPHWLHVTALQKAYRAQSETLLLIFWQNILIQNTNWCQ